MKVDANFVKSLIENGNPVSAVAQKAVSIWLSQNKDKVSDFYYKGEEEVSELEEFILKSYNEFFDVFARSCVDETRVFQQKPDETSFVVMDGMSLREGALIYEVLKGEGYDAKISYGFSAVPSDTAAFREKLPIPMENFKEIKSHKEIRVSGDEKYLWSYFPDIMLDKIQVGHAVISSLEEMYDITAKIIKVLVSKLEANKIVILSDHGYIRSEAGFVFPVSSKARSKLQDVFGNKRFVPMDDIDLGDLVDEGYVVEFAGHYVAKSRYVWPVKGRYGIYLHGGLSLMECLTPVIEVVKRKE
jgi:hypothetical protein